MILTKSPRYKAFIKSRDLVLESVYNKYVAAMSRGLDDLLGRVMDSAVVSMHQHTGEAHEIKRIVSYFESRIEDAFDGFGVELNSMIRSMRTSLYVLTLLGETEAIGQALNKDAVYNVTQEQLKSIHDKPLLDDQHAEARVYRALSKFKRKLVSEFEMAVLLEESDAEVRARILRAWPKKKRIKKKPRVTKPINQFTNQFTEAKDTQSTKEFSFGYMDDDIWDQILDSYLSKQVPFFKGRAGGKSAELYFEQEGKYEWEFEQELAHDFVSRLRDGSNEAAEKNGVTDMVWLAVIDDRTDDCCIARDGLTTEEIEEALDSGKIADDCDAIVPPAHVNCRCRLAPYFKDIEEFETVQPDFDDFNAWLDDKAKGK